MARFVPDPRLFSRLLREARDLGERIGAFITNHRPWSHVALLVLAATVPYLPAVKGGPIGEDRDRVFDDPVVRGDADPGAAFLDPWAPPAKVRRYQPLTISSLALDRWLGGGATLPFHLTNLALHTIAVWLLFTLLLTLGFDEVPALLGSLLFAVHPTHAETVAWISGRSWLLCFVAGTGALTLTLGPRFGRWTALAAGLLASVAGLAERGAFAWALLGIGLWLALGRGRPLGAHHRYGRPVPMVLGIAAAELARWLVVGAEELPVWSRAFPDLDLGGRLLVGLRLVGFDYPAMLLLPSHMRVEAPVLAREGLLSWPTWVALAAIVAAGALAVHGLRRGRIWSAIAPVWFVVLSFPHLHVLAPLAVAKSQRFGFAATSIFAVGTAMALSVRSERVRREGRRVAIVLVVAFAGLAGAASRTWTAEDRLWAVELAHDPGSPHGRLHRADRALAAGGAQANSRALAALDEALAVYPNHPELLARRVALDEGAVTGAGPHPLLARLAIRNPSSPVIPLIAARRERHRQRNAMAIAPYRRVRDLDPGDVESRARLGDLAWFRGEYGRAELLLLEAVDAVGRTDGLEEALRAIRRLKDLIELGKTSPVVVRDAVERAAARLPESRAEDRRVLLAALAP